MNKLMTALAGLSMIASVPAMAQHYDHGRNDSRAGVSIQLSTGDNGRRYYDPWRFNQHREWRNERLRYSQQYRYVPDCRGREVAIRSPYNYNRYTCVNQEDLYGRGGYRGYR